ncbi:hypothetical protein SAMN05421776_12176 [Nocardia farcinica]|uniref:HTH cro/C1-type domain-containing protein n=1 Tax=Nocardia farcinica TaxID=37329 RepID=A0A0H5PP14_NOCFR|nr:hypothetical protein [Nocardia farcinica]SLG32509.1 Uncharacterised protein [Mycobacteroides abscessus subsp. abscessus]PFW98828.1 hypothetical protein CJ469_05789 [Nocardia farcinica]PFX04434.1 hypothetical protein CJ468_05410 [Nocardia farcinica]CRY84186.1 Uncharacterised protein [Nocardia farcinica]CRY84501.1 Uncharacterised protein [Nocardia farcinica]
MDTPWWRYVEMLMNTHGITSFAEFARRIDVAASTPSVWRRSSDAKPNYDTVKRVANEFNRPLSEVMINAGLATPQELGQSPEKPELTLSNEQLYEILGQRLGVTPTPAPAKRDSGEQNTKARRQAKTRSK